MLQELPGGAPVNLLDELGHRELARTVNADKEIEFAISGLQLGNVNVEEANRVALEPLALMIKTRSRIIAKTRPLRGGRWLRRRPSGSGRSMLPNAANP